jgi:hypothetical protein
MINYQNEIVLTILSFLNVKDICSFTSVDKSLNKISKNYSELIADLMIKNSKFKYCEFKNDYSLRYVHNNNTYVFSYCKKSKIIKSKKEALIKFRENLIEKKII